jgi:hypothetical protein
MKKKTQKNKLQRRRQYRVNEPHRNTHHSPPDDGESTESTIALGAVMNGRGHGYVERTGVVLPKAGEE